jgi:Putative Actinobacterial Holin-X, holin superfamily III
VRADRSLVDVLNDIFGNLQDIVRSEIRLAKAEVSDDLRGAKSSALALAIALLASAFTALFLLLSGMYALRLVMSTWGAALCVALAMGIATVVSVLMTRRHIRARPSLAPRTARKIKENRQWAKQSIK